MAANVFYNRTLRKLIVGFGDIFKEIYMVRYNPDLTEEERFLVPLTYAPKEQYVMRLEEDPDLDKKVQLTLPRMSYEMNGFSYDSGRKLNTNTRNFANAPTGGVVGQYNPVPYNFDFSLYLYVRNIDDGAQIIEHILPYFTPDYTIKLNMIPEMGVIKEVPVVLKDVQQDLRYEGNKDSEPRMIIFTLTFTVKSYIFGPVSTVGLIKHTITNFYNKSTSDEVFTFIMNPATGTGNYRVGETVYQGYSPGAFTASGKVVSWSNNQLQLDNLSGNFVSNEPIKGLSTNASYMFTQYSPGAMQYASISITPNPANANANSNYTYTTQVTEF